MKLYKYHISIYTVILTLYYLLTMLFPNVGYGTDQAAERIYPQMLMGMIGIISLFITIIKFNRLYKSKICRAYLIYLFVTFIYVFFPIEGKTLFENFIGFLKYNMAILTLFVFYCFLKENRPKATQCLFFIYWVQFIYSMESLLMDRFVYLAQNDMFNSNAGFNLIAAVPMTLILPNKRVRLYAYIILVLACLISGQRSAALAAVISIPFSISHLRQSIKKTDIYILVFLGIIAIYPIVHMAYSNIMNRMDVEANSGAVGSGRSIFWAILLIDFFDHNIFRIFFGNGLFSTQTLLMQKYGMAIDAHNGWIQNLYVFGILGLILYARTVFILFKQNRIVNKILPKYTNVLLVCFLIFITKCSTSHGNWDISVMPFALVIAYISSQYNPSNRGLNTHMEDNKLSK